VATGEGGRSLGNRSLISGHTYRFEPVIEIWNSHALLTAKSDEWSGRRIRRKGGYPLRQRFSLWDAAIVELYVAFPQENREQWDAWVLDVEKNDAYLGAATFETLTSASVSSHRAKNDGPCHYLLQRCKVVSELKMSCPLSTYHYSHLAPNCPKLAPNCK
jgi:hypothetical protein